MPNLMPDHIPQTPGTLDLSLPGPYIYWRNFATIIPEDQIRSVLTAIQIQITRDLFPVWGVNAQIDAYDFHRSYNCAQVVFFDRKETADVMGFGQTGQLGAPLAKVYIQDIIDRGNRWSVIASQEIISMVIDPHANLTVFNQDSPNSGTLVALEICDPVASDAFGYDIGDVRVSNFVYPDWFTPGLVGRMDYCNHVERSLQLGSNGYVNRYPIPGSGWVETMSDDRSTNLYRSEDRKILRSTPTDLRTFSNQ